MGDAARVMALLTFTLPKGMPLIYTGQEIGYDHRFAFFEKDPVPQWCENEFGEFYAALARLRHEHPALASGVPKHAIRPKGACPTAYSASRAAPGATR